MMMMILRMKNLYSVRKVPVYKFVYIHYRICMISQDDFNNCVSPLTQNTTIRSKMKTYIIDNGVAGITFKTHNDVADTLKKHEFRKNNFKTIYVKTTYVAGITNTNEMILMDPHLINALENNAVSIKTLFDSTTPLSTYIYRDKELTDRINVVR